MEKWEKNHLFGPFSKGGTDTKQSGTSTTLVLSIGTGTGTGVHCFVLDSVLILAIICSFLIRFE